MVPWLSLVVLVRGDGAEAVWSEGRVVLGEGGGGVTAYQGGDGGSSSGFVPVRASIGVEDGV